MYQAKSDLCVMTINIEPPIVSASAIYGDTAQLPEQPMHAPKQHGA